MINEINRSSTFDFKHEEEDPKENTNENTFSLYHYQYRINLAVFFCIWVCKKLFYFQTTPFI